MFGGWTPRVQVARSTATGVVACTCQRLLCLCSDRVTYLQHLDKGHTQVQVCLVTADQTQAEEDTDGDDGTEVDPAGHLNSLASIEKGGIAGKQLRRDGCEGQMVGGQNDRVS